MAARKAWVVFIDSPDHLFSDHQIQGKYNQPEESTDFFSVFFRENQAIEWAKMAAIRYPGKDVHVLKQAYGFSSQPRPPEHKEWDAEGRFVPVEK